MSRRGDSHRIADTTDETDDDWSGPTDCGISHQQIRKIPANPLLTQLRHGEGRKPGKPFRFATSIVSPCKLSTTSQVAKSAPARRAATHQASEADVAAYQSLVTLINKKFNPANDIEQHLTQTIADTEWRLLRIPTLESGFYALGRHELAADCAHEPDPQLRAAMLEAHIFRTYQKDLRNLALQERRLRNQLKQDTAELRRLQQERLEQETAEKTEAKPASVQNGFEFSTPPANSFPAAEDATQPAEIHQEMEAAA